MPLLIPYLLLLISLTVFSYGFVDLNFPLSVPAFLSGFVFYHHRITAVIYSLIVILFFIFYFQFLSLVKARKWLTKKIWQVIFLTTAILFFAFPAFSYDVFNYMATARMTFLHHENPYLIMPLEIPNEPMLKFTHAANKTALYGPFWILLTALPHLIGLGNLIFTVFTFKLLVFSFYFGLIWLIWKLSNKNLYSLAFFALNPLVVIETLLGGHNDVVMMFFSLLAFYFLKQKRNFFASLSFFASVMIKFATIFLFPIFLYVLWQNWQKKVIEWPKIWSWSFLAMLLVFLLSPLREEIYSWYFIWPLTFASLMPLRQILLAVSSAFSIGLLFRFSPFLYTQSWRGITPLVKRIVTFTPPLITFFYLKISKCALKK